METFQDDNCGWQQDTVSDGDVPITLSTGSPGQEGLGQQTNSLSRPVAVRATRHELRRVRICLRKCNLWPRPLQTICINFLSATWLESAPPPPPLVSLAYAKASKESSERDRAPRCSLLHLACSLQDMHVVPLQQRNCFQLTS